MGRTEIAEVIIGVVVVTITQDEQVACFANRAAHLEPEGAVLIEIGVPDLRQLPPGEDARIFAHGPGYVGYVDFIAQQAASHHLVADGTAVSKSTIPFRYV
jgi:hypothetical protein